MRWPLLTREVRFRTPNRSIWFDNIVSPIGKYQHNPSVKLSQGFWDKIFAGLGEDGANQPQVERVRGQGEDVGVRPGPLLQGLARAVGVAWPLLIKLIARVRLVNMQSSLHVAVKRVR